MLLTTSLCMASAAAAECVSAETPALQGPAWNLGDLYASPEDPRIEEDLTACAGTAAALETDYKGKLALLSGDALAGMLERYEVLEERLGRVYSYASLLFAAHRDDAVIGRFFQGVQERGNDISTRLLFVTLELNKLDDALLAQGLEQSPALAHLKPWLDQVRSYRPHQLDDEIERV